MNNSLGGRRRAPGALCCRQFAACFTSWVTELSFDKQRSPRSIFHPFLFGNTCFLRGGTVRGERGEVCGGRISLEQNKLNGEGISCCGFIVVRV